MKHFVRKHKHKLIAGHGIAVFTLLAASALSVGNGDTVIFFTPHSSTTLVIGDTTDIDIDITTKVPINAIGVTVSYPPESLDILSISKEDSFLDLWTEDTVIKESEGLIRFSGGTLQKGGLLGTDTALTFKVRARRPGEATLTFETVEVFSSDGTGAMVNSTTRTVSYTIAGTTTPSGGAPVTAGATPTETTEDSFPSADFDGNDRVTLVDVSILMIRMTGPYNPRYDLDRNGTIGISDLSILFSHMRQQ